ncbi:MAG: hypothetical protein WD381_00940 [Balneolaceae bacterium]
MMNTKFENWIFNSYSPTANGLALYRIFAALFFLIFLFPDVAFYSTLESLPDEFFTPPPGPMMLFDEFPPEIFLRFVHGLLMVSWVGVLVGFKTKWSSILAGLSMLVLQGFMFSLGKINHEILLSVTPVVMAFSNWGASFSVDSISEKKEVSVEGWPIVLLALFLGFMMFTAGFPKILGGWLDPSTQATRGHLFNQFFVRERQELLAIYAVRFDAAFVWELLDWATIIFEVGFLIAVWKAGWTRLFICCATIFHFSTMMTLNMPFLVNFLIYAAFVKWDSVFQYLKKIVGFLSEKKYGVMNDDKWVWSVAIIVGSLFLILRVLSNTGYLMTSAEPSLHDVVLVSAAVLIVFGLGIKKLMSTAKSISS